MKKDVKVEFLKAKNLDACIELIKEKGKFNILSEYANFYDRRTYFKVNENGDIFQKHIILSLYFIYFVMMKKSWQIIFLNIHMLKKSKI